MTGPKSLLYVVCVSAFWNSRETPHTDLVTTVNGVSFPLCNLLAEDLVAMFSLFFCSGYYKVDTSGYYKKSYYIAFYIDSIVFYCILLSLILSYSILDINIPPIYL